MAKLDNPPRSLLDGRKTVTTAGTAVQLVSSSTPINEVVITALSSNTGTITVGASTVKAAAAERRGQPLAAGQSVTVSVQDLASVFIDATVNGEGVSFLAAVG